MHAYLHVYSLLNVSLKMCRKNQNYSNEQLRAYNVMFWIYWINMRLFNDYSIIFSLYMSILKYLKYKILSAIHDEVLS